ncbi:double zinc ribbon domain-containing protein [Hymenobacter sp. HDW8]|uniref:double zinc ribbon domain-containing protein n=1 Tax=Hymenobacter sp. HDW8 TaxID=2714932 RepID=UPI001F0F0B02|nr:double zinc ribbon domain-containing protein [Hymenobacter sp. HDW8]
MIRTALADFVSLIFPQVCLACDEPLARGEDHICTGCRAQFPYTDYHKLPPTRIRWPVSSGVSCPCDIP